MSEDCEKTWEQLTLFESDQDICYGKTYREHLVHPEETISLPFSKKRAASPTIAYQFLDLTEGGGCLLGALWEIASPFVGEFLTLNTGESPKDAAESSLSRILEDKPHPKYYLSKTACSGILRRAKARNRELPKALREALEIQAGRKCSV